jgi:CheY-like chemotaxis protein
LTECSLSGLKVLVLEDEFLIAMDVEQICRDHGADGVTIRRQLSEIDEQLWTDGFDVAVIDMLLEGNPTLPFARTLKERNIPFLFASGYADIADLRSEFPDVRLVSKPYSESDLVKAILASVGRSGG